jgi:hypothetical protein
MGSTRLAVAKLVVSHAVSRQLRLTQTVFGMTTPANEAWLAKNSAVDLPGSTPASSSSAARVFNSLTRGSRRDPVLRRGTYGRRSVGLGQGRHRMP